MNEIHYELIELSLCGLQKGCQVFETAITWDRGSGLISMGLLTAYNDTSFHIKSKKEADASLAVLEWAHFKSSGWRVYLVEGVKNYRFFF